MDALIYYKKTINSIINKYNEAIMSGACPNIIVQTCSINYILLKVYLAKFTYTLSLGNCIMLFSLFFKIIKLF